MNNEQHIKYIDGLRALAVCAVLEFHICTELHLHNATLLGYMLGLGQHGVSLFFIISGFCLSYPTLSRLQTKRSQQFTLPHYALKRIVRIVPPYWLAIGLTLLAAHYCGYTIPIAIGATHSFGWWDVFRQAVFFDQNTILINKSYWSLAYEFHWYIVFPCALFLWTRFPLLFWLWLISCNFNFLNTNGANHGMLTALLLGIVAAHIKIREYRFANLAPVGLIGSIPFAFLLDSGPPHLPTQANFGWFLVCFFGIVWAGQAAPLRSLLSWTPLVALGGISYSLYLVHEPIVSLIVTHVPNLATSGKIALCVIASLVSGTLFWSVGERPFYQENTRKILIAKMLPSVCKVFRWLHLPQSLTLASYSHEGQPKSL